MAEPGESTLPDTLGTVPRLLEGFGREENSLKAVVSMLGNKCLRYSVVVQRPSAKAKMGAFERDQETDSAKTAQSRK
jgi:hypothetical protein